jgi:hypothetical protein
MKIEQTALSSVDDGISDALRREVIALVDAKLLVDMIARPSGSRLTEGLHDGGYGPKDGNEFFRAILPFSSRSPIGKAFPAMVPTRQTIGCSWKWWKDSLDADKVESYRAFFLDPARADEGPNRAEYDWIQALGLFLAGEGKNRVTFLREMNEDWIPAHVTPCTYPAADRIAIYREKFAGEEKFWAVLDDRFAEPLEQPRWAMPILRAYGVELHASWPARFPSLDSVLVEWNWAKERQTGNSVDPLDLAELRSRDDHLAEEVMCSLTDIEELRFDWRIHIAAFIAGVIAVLSTAALPTEWAEVRSGTCLIAGFLCCIALFPILNIVRMPRRHLRGSQRF